MSKFKQWLAYWRESLEQCREANDMIIYIVFMLSVGVALAGELAGFKISGLDFLADPLTHKISIIVAVSIFVWILLWLPFQRHESEKTKHTEEKEAQTALLRGQISNLESEIRSLAEKLAEKSEADKLVLARQEAKNTLGIDLLALNKRLGEAREMSRYEFIDKVKDDAWTDTNELFHKVQSDLALKLTLAEYSRFNITAGESVKEITDDPYFGQRNMDWRWHYNCILAKRDKLTEIIKELG